MIKMYVEHLLNHSIDIIGAFNKKVYEAAVLKIMNDSQNVFPSIYERVNIQSNGECDFFDKTTGVKFDAKLPFDEKQIKRLTNGEKHAPDFDGWIKEMCEEACEYYFCMCKTKKISETNLYRIIKEKIEKDKRDENIVLFIPFPITVSSPCSIYDQFSTDFLKAIYEELEKNSVLKGRTVYAIYPSTQKNIFAVRDLNYCYCDFVKCNMFDKCFSYEISGYGIIREPKEKLQFEKMDLEKIDLMNTNWTYSTIGDVCIVERGGSPRPIDKYITEDSNGVNWIKIGDTNDSMYITETVQKIKPEGIRKSRYVHAGDFLLSNSMSFGRPYILKIDGCIHDGWLVLKDNDNIFDKRFLYYYLSAKPTYEKFKRMAVGGVVNNLNSDMVRSLLVPIPPKQVQEKVADLLDKINSIVSIRKQQLKKLDELVKSRFIEMFGSISDDKKVSMSDVCLVITDGTHQPPKFTSSGIPFLFVSNIVGNEITYDAEKYISEETYAQLIKRTPIEIGDVLLSTVGSYGHPAVVKSNKPFCFQRHIAYLKPKTQLIDSCYLHGAILSLDVQKQIEGRVKGIAQKTLNLSEIRKLRLPLPAIVEQKQFAAFVEQVDKSKFVIQQALDKAQLLFDSLMQKYFG